MEKVVVDVNLTEDDVYIFQKSVLFQKASQSTIIIIYLLFMAFLGISFYDDISNGRNITNSIVLMIVPTAVLILMPRSLKKSSKNLMRTSKLMQKTQRYEVSCEGISISSDAASGFIKWSELFKAQESKESFMFFISKQQAYIIPKRCLDNDPERIEFIKDCLVNAPVPPKEKRGLIKKIFGFGLLTYIILFFVILFILFIFQP